MSADDHLQPRLFDPGPTVPSFHTRMANEGNPVPGSFKINEGWQNSAHRSFAAKADTGNTTDESHLPMFMSARQIMDKYQPLDADRQGVEDYRDNTATGRSRLTGGGTNWERRTWTGTPRHGYRQHTPATDRRYSRSETVETDEQLWDRKYDEASLSRDEYEAEVHGKWASPRYDRPGGGETRASGTWRSKWATDTDTPRKTQTYEPFDPAGEGGASIMESVLKEGVKAPVSLSTTQFGSQGLPQIVGGHHRLAVMGREKPDTLLPVSHHEDIHSAQRNPNWKYT